MSETVSHPTTRRSGADTPPTTTRRSGADLLSGTVFTVVGAGFALGARGYGMGAEGQLGAGSFPVLVGVLLAIFGVLVLVRGLVRGQHGAVGALPWGRMGLIALALVLFTVLIDLIDIGLVPATLVAAFVAGLAGLRPPLTRRLLIRTTTVAVGITVLCALIFVVGLQLNIPLIG